MEAVMDEHGMLAPLTRLMVDMTELDTALLVGAEAALHWLNHEEPKLEEVRSALIGIVSDARRRMEITARVRVMIGNRPTPEP
jgi:hypothetical protein